MLRAANSNVSTPATTAPKDTAPVIASSQRVTRSRSKSNASPLPTEDGTESSRGDASPMIGREIQFAGKGPTATAALETVVEEPEEEEVHEMEQSVVKDVVHEEDKNEQEGDQDAEKEKEEVVQEQIMLTSSSSSSSQSTRMPSQVLSGTDQPYNTAISFEKPIATTNGDNVSVGSNGNVSSSQLIFPSQSSAFFTAPSPPPSDPIFSATSSSSSSNGSRGNLVVPAIVGESPQSMRSPLIVSGNKIAPLSISSIAPMSNRIQNSIQKTNTATEKDGEAEDRNLTGRRVAKVLAGIGKLKGYVGRLLG